MKNYINRIVIVSSILISSLLFGALPAANVSAVSDVFVKKAQAEGVYNCWDTSFEEKLKVQDLTDDLKKLVKNNGTVYMPTGLTSANWDRVNCRQLISGSSGTSKLLKTIGTEPKDKAQTLKNIGYAHDGGNSPSTDNQCVRFYYHYIEKRTTISVLFNEEKIIEDKDIYTKYLCTDIDSNGTIMSDQMWAIEAEGDNTAAEWEISWGKVQIDCAQWWPGAGGCGAHTYTKGSTKWEEYWTGILADLVEHNSSGSVVACSGLNNYTPFLTTMYDCIYTIGNSNYQESKDPAHVVETTSEDDLKAEYKKTATKASMTTVKALVDTSYSAYSKIALTNQEKFALYQYYLNNFYGAYTTELDCGEYTGAAAALRAGQTPVRLYDPSDKTVKSNCYVKATKNEDKKVNGVKSDNHFTQQVGFDEIVSALNALTDVTTLPDGLLDGLTSSASGETEGEGGDEEKEPSCFDNAGSLGWIVCPMIDWFSNFIQGAYEALVVPFMVLDAGLFTNDAARNVWEVFRNFANTAFIILFLVVIFSQLTGVGIDNYGIKKILPKLFVTAVLVNLSYIICQLAVDVSNIIGKSIGDLLSLDAGEFSMSEVPDAKVNLGAGAIVVQVIAGVLALGIVTTKGIAILIPVFMGLLSIAIAIFFLFVLLAVRKAFALILVIVSPMAFICYALPNTKKIFDKWFNTFKGLLLAFPVCSAMVYGGQFAAKIILMSAAGCSTSAKGCGGAVAFSLILTAAVISIVPIFLIPKALQASMGAIAMGIARAHHGTAGYLRGKARRRLDESRLNDRTRYREQMRGAKNAARQGEYNARRGQRYLTKQQERGNADLTKMTPTQRAAYLNAQGQVDARDKAMQSAWSTRFGELPGGDEARAKELKRLADSGELDKNSLIAGLGSIKDADKLTAAFNSVRNSEAGRELLSDAKVRSSVADTMRSGDGIINQSMGKVLGRMNDNEFRNTDDASFKKQVAAKVQGAGTGVMASQNKDVFATEDAASYFSSKQLAAGMGANYSGDTEKSFNSMLAGTSAQTKQETAAELSATNISNMSASTMDSLSYTDGSGQSVSGADVVKNGAADAINTLNSEDGARLRANMDSSVKNALGITGEGGGSTGTGGGGGDSGSTPAPTDDDSAAYQAKLEEMSQRQAAQGGGGSIDIPHEDAGPMRGDHGRGINDATGKERSAEGNRFDYHPKQSGESNADYSARSSWEKHISDLSEQHPLKPGESTSDWMKRVGAPTQAEWKASHGSGS